MNWIGVICDSRGRVFNGTFIDIMLTGLGSISFINGAYEKGNYFKYFLDGEGERHFQNGNYYKGVFRIDKYEGNGLYYWAAQNISYEGGFLKGKRNGAGELKLPGGISITGVWKNDCPEGEFSIQKQTEKAGEYGTTI